MMRILPDFFFRSRENIDVRDFIAKGVDPSKFHEFWWGVRIEHRSITFDEAIDRIYDNGIFQIKAVNQLVVEDEESQIELLNLRHYAFSLLRKADPASFAFSRLEVDMDSDVFAPRQQRIRVSFLT